MKYLILYFLLCSLTWAQDFNEIQGQLILDAETISQGDIVDAKLQIWPIKSETTEDFKTYVGKNFLDMFYVSEVYKAEQSKNNSEVLEIDLSLVVLKLIDKEKPLILSHKGLNIPVNLRTSNILETKLNGKKFIIFDQLVKPSTFYNRIFTGILSIVLILAALVGFFFYKKKKLENIKKEKMLNEQKFWTTRLKEAKSRSEFEELYEKRAKWLEKCSIDEKAFKSFEKLMQKHQYKKDWNTEIDSAIKESTKELRES